MLPRKQAEGSGIPISNQRGSGQADSAAAARGERFVLIEPGRNLEVES